MSRWQSWRHRHYWFSILFILFISFRLLAILLLRPGGFVADNSDYDFYQAWGQTIPMGYVTFQNLWTAYPPLFAALMLPVFELSSRIPPWVEPRLFFHVLFGLLLLLFEAGNLILIYRLAGKVTHDEAPITDPMAQFTLRNSPLLPPLLYALMFAPVYTLLGWFEAMPLFFMLLGLDLLLSRRRGAWIGSAVAAALGFLVKLTPVLLVPIAVRWLGARLSVAAARHEWFNFAAPPAPRFRGGRNLLKPALYCLIFVGVTVAIGYPLAQFNPQLALSSFRVNSIRPPWQSVWALIDGYYGYGLVPVDMRNMQGFVAGGQWVTRLPWTLITVAFAGVYLWIYTRRYDWARVRTPIAFAAVSVVWLFLYSKGWSPQFLVWIVAFLVLLTPTLYGVILAIALTLINFIETSVFLLMLPAEHWIMTGTVLVRTALLLLLAVEWLGQIWPHAARGQRMRWLAARAAWVVLGAALIGALIGTPRAAQAYRERRLAEHPCQAAVETLRAAAGGPNRTLATPQVAVWRDLYPWLRADYDIHVLDSYDPNDRPAADVIGDKLAVLAGAGEFWWVEQPNHPEDGWSPAATAFFARPIIYRMDEQMLGACRVARVIAAPPDTALAQADTAGSPITLRAFASGPATSGQPLQFVLYWQTDAPVAASYTVFTQLFDPAGQLVTQQDNLPVNGLAPTNTWQPGTLIRDSYALALPPTASAGAYTLQVGLYDADGRRMLRLADGTQADHLTIPIHVD